MTNCEERWDMSRERESNYDLLRAFIISVQRNKNYKTFYRKSIENIGVQIMICSIIYFVYNITPIIRGGWRC